MRAAHFHQNLRATFGRKSVAIFVMSAVMAFNLGPLEAKAADTVVNCSGGGSFTVSDSDGLIVATNTSTCAGTAVIPEGVTRIERFENNRNISRVEIPASVTSMDFFAFYGTSNLSTVVIAPGSNLTSIPTLAFTNSGLTAFEVPASVTSIGEEAFSGCSSLTSFTFESGSQLQSIGRSAFMNAGLTSVSLPDSLTTIGNRAFGGNRSLTAVSFGLGSQLTTIGEEAFVYTALISIALGSQLQFVSLQSFPPNTTIGISSNNPYLALQDGVLFGSAMTRVINYPSSSTAPSYVIPNTVTVIEPEAFRNARFTSVTIPNSVISIGSFAFEGSKLEAAIIPASVSTIGYAAFAGNSNLNSVVFAPGSTLTHIGYRAFEGDRSLTSIDLTPAMRLIRIYYFAFQNTGLTSVELPASLEYIEEAAFRDSVSLTTVTFEANSRLRQIYPYAFLGTSVTSLDLPAPPTRIGHTFLGWSQAEQGEIVENAYSLVSQGSRIFSVWGVKSFSVTYDSKGGSSVTNGSFLTDGSLDIPFDPSRAGYSFLGWSATDGGEPVSFPYSPGVTTNVTLYALWSADSHTVSFNSNGGSIVSASSFETDGSIGDPAVPTRVGYSFLGWSATDGGSAVEFPYSPGVISDVTLYALWSADSHQVTFDSKNGSAVSAGSFVTAGSVAAPSAPTREGYIFAGWSATDGGEAVTFPYSPGVTTGVTLYALWSEITAPSVPLNVSATAGNKTATVSWVAPSSNGGGSIISYLVTASSGQTCSVVVLTCTLTGLVNKTGVTFTVQAINSAGSGTPSAPSASVTPDSNDDVLPPGDDGDAAPKAIASGGKFVTSNDPTLLFSWSKSTGKLVSNATGKYIGYIEAKMSFTKAGKVHTCSTVFGDLKVLPQKTAAQKAAAMKTKTFAGNPFCVSKIKMDSKSLDPKGGMTAANFKKIKSMNKTSAELAKEKAALTALKGFTGVVEVDVVRYRAWPTTMLNFGDHTGKGGKIPSMIRNTKISLG